MADTQNNTIKTRVQLKYDSYTEWNKVATSFQPLKGEICIVNPATTLAEAGRTPCLIKIGDGNTKFDKLPWLSAIAADIYAWAKKETPDWADFPALPIEVIDNGTGKFITNITYSANKITITRANVAWGDVTGKPEKLVNTVKTNGGDTVVILKPTSATSGDVTIEGEHAKKGPTGGYTGTQTDDTVDAFGDSITITVPKLTVDEYGHTNAVEEATYTVSIPANPNTNTTLTEGDGIDIQNTAAADATPNYKVSVDIGSGLKFTTDADKKVAHQDRITTGGTDLKDVKNGNTSVVTDDNAAKGKFINAVKVDDFGHIVSATMGTETGIVITGSTASTPSTDTVKVLSDVTNTANDDYHGHNIARSYVNLPTKAYVDKMTAAMAAGGVQYFGTLRSEAELETFQTNNEITKGDFFRASVDFDGEFILDVDGDGNNIVTTHVHAGDLIIAEQNSPAPSIDGRNWNIIHGDEGDITDVVAGTDLTGGGSVGEVEISHATITRKDDNTVESDLAHEGEFTVVTGVVSSTTGHITNVKTTKFTLPEDHDEHVTSVANHYTPTATDAHTISKDASGATSAASWNTTNLVTGVNIKRDAAGHVTDVTLDSIKMPANPDTHHEAKNVVTNSATGKANAATTTNGNVRINLVENNTVRSSNVIKGAGEVTVTSDANGAITITGATPVSDTAETGKVTVAVKKDSSNNITTEKEDVAKVLADSSNIQYLIFDCGSATEVV